MTDLSIFSDEQLTEMQPHIAARFDDNARNGWLALAEGEHHQLVAIRAEIERRAATANSAQEAA